MELMSPSMPSINTSGLASEPSPIVPVPRILMLILLSNAPLVVVICNPGTTPCRACTAFCTGRDVSASESTVPTEPVRLTFFCVPKPTTTTSSKVLVSSCSMILRTDCPVYFTSFVVYPTNEICRILPFFTPSRVNRPSMSVVVPFVVPLTTTVAPITVPKASSTVPVTFPFCWEILVLG